MTTKKNTNTSIVEDKKKEKSNLLQKNSTSIWSLIIIIFISLVVIFGYFWISAAILFSCKVGQANIIPTNKDCYPFTDNKQNIQEIETNIFITNTDPQESVKLKFPYNDKNSKNFILDTFRKYKNSPNSNFLINYFISIIEGVINYNNNALNLFLSNFNKLPELLIVLLGPVIYIVFLILVQIVGFFVSIYYYFYSLTWMFKTNTNTNINSNAKWENVSLLSPMRYGLSVFLLIVSFISFWILLFTILPILPIIVLYLCVFSILGYVGKVKEKNTNIFDISKEFFKFYKVTIASIVSIFIIILSFLSSYGVTAGLISLLIVFLIYVGVIPLNLFKSVPLENLSQLTGFEQAKKTCNSAKSNFFTNFFNYQKGGNFSKELQKISKKIINNKLN